ncbi:dipeptide ABC transporter ATP-binding protein [Nocardia aurantiaca]|uniref:Dipeptide ABC transporter ATP-binding protein n=1 Tax=Nocardia aurantiaca TaxID=2675850 RepID=A0A6I3KXP0_9NOCA|nr:ABC transporter ATP-binding protein [Nocardia aurantiaca]MTE12259.1 dipeptide ABC transporter ATP-binding protein [Nocardia aurantiaca]
MTEPLLEIRDLRVAFGAGERRVDAVRGVDLTVYPGQTVALVGESGSGKSTTAHAVIGLLPRGGQIAAGSIRFDGRELAHASPSEFVAVRGNGIGFVPQDPMTNLDPVWKIGFQIRETLAANGIARGRAARRRAVELLAEAGIPDAVSRIGQYPHEFSGGMKQRTLIAIGLSARPKLLIADEPTSALDVTVQRQILDHIDGLTRELGTAVLLITHDLGLAAERAEHLVVMYRGRVVESGPAPEILRDPRHEYTRRLVDAAPSIAARRVSAGRKRVGIRQLAVEVADTETGGELPDDILVLDRLTRRYRLRGSMPWRHTELAAAEDVSFRVRRGTTTAVVGESGSGKTTVANLVLGLDTPTSGSVTFDGSNVVELAKREPLAFRRRVQPIFQNPYGSLDPTYSIHRSIAEPLRVHGVGARAERDRRVHDLLELVALPSGVAGRYPSELSGGQRQRVAIARALALEPELVVCDEAVSALDVLVQAQILQLLNQLQAELGLTYLFITHDLAVVRQIADDVVVMQQGKVVEAASTTEVFGNPQSEYTRRLLDAIPGPDPSRYDSPGVGGLSDTRQ